MSKLALICAGAIAAVLAMGAASSGLAPLSGKPTYLLCNKVSAPELALFKKRPRRCMMLNKRAPFARGANLRAIRWKRWGGKVARGRGIEMGFHRPFAKVKVRIRAFRRRLEACSRRSLIYTRVRVTSRYGSMVVTPRTCAGY